jgi:hypothetical protein
MANILNTNEDYNPKNGLKNIFTKLVEIIKALNTNTDAIAALPVPPKTYKALLTQTGTDDPSVTVLVNTLGTTPVHSRVGNGVFEINTADPVFEQTKTLLYPITSIDVDFSYSFVWSSTTKLFINTAMSGVKSNDLLYYTLIIIEVYP